MAVRLTNKAYKILTAGIAKAAAKDELAGEVASNIALKRLQRLNTSQGKPVEEAEIKCLIVDVFPDFDDRIIKKAARANRPSSSLWLIPKLAIGVTSLTAGLTGLIWVLNLPYPMIRRPVAKAAPILLLPSYLKMDRNYRGAIAKVEQADRLVNQATSLADLKLGQEKVTQAQQHLDALPVWFLGYEPQMYRTMFSFGWKFTFDEFEAARKQVGRMDAKIFQEINAITKLEQAQADIQQAKQEYQQAENMANRQKAIATWQAGIDRLNQLPAKTLAKEQANSSYEAYIRDFRHTSGLVAGNNRTNKIISVARQFHAKVTSSCDRSAHSVNRWQECANLLRKAIAILEQVPLEDAGYLETQTLLANYETELAEIKIRQQEEAESQRAYNLAQSLITNLPKSVNRNNRDRTARDILTIINKLERVKPKTTVYEEARTMMSFANQKLKQLR